MSQIGQMVISKRQALQKRIKDFFILSLYVNTFKMISNMWLVKKSNPCLSLKTIGENCSSTLTVVHHLH